MLLTTVLAAYPAALMEEAVAPAASDVIQTDVEEPVVEAEASGDDEDAETVACNVDEEIGEASLDLDDADGEIMEATLDLGDADETVAEETIAPCDTNSEPADAANAVIIADDGSVAVNSTNFPDNDLRQYILYYLAQGSTTLTQEQRNRVTSIGGETLAGTITDFTGIECFPNLVSLRISGQATVMPPAETLARLTSVDLCDADASTFDFSRMPNLTTLSLGKRTAGAPFKMPNLNALPNIVSLGLYNHTDTEIDATNVSAFPNVDTLSIQGDASKIRLPAFGAFPRLKRLSFWAGNVETLDLSANPGITVIDIYDRAHKTLNLSNCSEVVRIEIGDCGMTSLDISDCKKLIPYIKDEYKQSGDDGLTYSHNDEASGVRFSLTVPQGVKLIFTEVTNDDSGTSTEPSTTPASSTPDTPAVISAPATPNPATAVVPAVNKSSSASISAAPGEHVKLDLGGATGKGFKSSNKKVATVDQNGEITVKKAGKAKITFKVGKKKRTVTIKIADPTVPKHVTLNMTGLNPVAKGSTVTLTPTVDAGPTPPSPGNPPTRRSPP